MYQRLVRNYDGGYANYAALEEVSALEAEELVRFHNSGFVGDHLTDPLYTTLSDRISSPDSDSTGINPDCVDDDCKRSALTTLLMNT